VIEIVTLKLLSKSDFFFELMSQILNLCFVVLGDDFILLSFNEEALSSLLLLRMHGLEFA